MKSSIFDTDSHFWDDLVVTGDGAIETDFGTLPVEDVVEARPPSFGGTNLIEGEFGIPLMAADLIKLVKLFRPFFEHEPALHRLCRIVTSFDSVRIDADKVSSFLRFTLSTKPVNFTSENPITLIVSFDDLYAAANAIVEHGAMKVSNEKVYFYADDRFGRPLLTYTFAQTPLTDISRLLHVAAPTTSSIARAAWGAPGMIPARLLVEHGMPPEEEINLVRNRTQRRCRKLDQGDVVRQSKTIHR
jgi:hypothetical protein